MQASVQQCEHAQARLAVIAAGVFNDQRGIPVEFRSQFKGQAALRYVPFVLAGSKVNRMIYCYSNNCTRSRLNATEFTRYRRKRAIPLICSAPASPDDSFGIGRLSFLGRGRKGQPGNAADP
jgi:hypothetical protein